MTRLHWAATLAGLLVLFLPCKKRRSLEGLLLALISLCGMAALSGCGNCTDLGTRPGSYTVQVIGTPVGAGAGSTATVTAKVNVKVVVN